MYSYRLISQGWKKRNDFTGDQASTHRRHVLVFLKKDIEKAKETLFRVSPELSTLSQQVLLHGDNDDRLKLDTSLESPRKRTKSSEESCKCTGGCTTHRCVW